MVENDYMMRIIHEMVRTIVMLIFHKDQETEEELIFLDGVSQDFYQRLCHLADVGKSTKQRICSIKIWKKMTGTKKKPW